MTAKPALVQSAAQRVPAATEPPRPWLNSTTGTCAPVAGMRIRTGMSRLRALSCQTALQTTASEAAAFWALAVPTVKNIATHSIGIATSIGPRLRFIFNLAS
jgi:hypothetical protein